MFIMLFLEFSNIWVYVSGAGFFLCCGLSFSLGSGNWCVSVLLLKVCCFRRGGIGALILSVGLGWLAFESSWSGGLRGCFGVYILGVALFAWRLGSLAR